MSCICVWLSRVNTPIFIFSQSECAKIISECESHQGFYVNQNFCASKQVKNKPFCYLYYIARTLGWKQWGLACQYILRVPQNLKKSPTQIWHLLTKKTQKTSTLSLVFLVSCIYKILRRLLLNQLSVTKNTEKNYIIADNWFKKRRLRIHWLEYQQSTLVCSFVLLRISQFGSL